MDLHTLKNLPPWDWPESAADVLLDAITDRSMPEADRLLAAELAGDTTVVDARIARQLLTVLEASDEPERLRAQAAISLGPALEYVDTMGGDDEESPLHDEDFLEVQSRLRAAFDDPGVPVNVRRSVLEASVRAPQPWHQASIEAAYASQEPAWRLTAVFCMRYVKGFEARILASLDDEQPDIRRQAVLAAGEWELAAAWPAVEEILASGRDKELVLAAIEAAAGMDPNKAEPLLSVLTESGDTDIASSAWEALASMEGPPTGKMSVHDDLLN